MKKIGLVGGISWVSTIDYYRYINTGINERLGGLNFAECILYSLNFNDIQSRGWNNSYDLLFDACKKLEQTGADAILLCANTAHQFIEKLEEKIEVPIIDIVAATATTIEKYGFKTVGLLGTKFTMEMDFFKSGLKKKGIKTLIPELQDTRNYIQQTVKEELGKGIIKQETKKGYISISNELIANGAEAIILGCTEIPMLINQDDVPVPVFDTTKIHSQAAVEFVLTDL
jgi:aspartate racemase